MGRNYTSRYLRDQESRYRGNQSRGRQSSLFEVMAGVRTTYAGPFLGGPPEGFQEVIMEWLDNNLTPVVKKHIAFQKEIGSTNILLRTDLSHLSEHRHLGFRSTVMGFIRFRETDISITCSDTGLSVAVEYAHPQLFEILRTALSKFYNGIA